MRGCRPVCLVLMWDSPVAEFMVFLVPKGVVFLVAIGAEGMGSLVTNGAE